MHVIAEADDGHAAIDTAARLRPGVAVLDISMPGYDGIEATRRVLKAAPSTRVVILTVQEEGSYVGQVLRAGAHGYVLKVRQRASWFALSARWPAAACT